MTEAQRDYIKTLERKCLAAGIDISAEDFLGTGWEKLYKTFTQYSTQECIDYLKTTLKYGRD